VQQTSQFQVRAASYRCKWLQNLLFSYVTVLGSGALSSETYRVCPTEAYVMLPVRAADGAEMEMDGHNHAPNSHDDSERGTAGGCCGGSAGHSHRTDAGSGCCGGGGGAHDHDHAHSDGGTALRRTAWDRRAAEMTEQERARSTELVDTSSVLLVQAALDLLVNLACHVHSTDDPLFLALSTCCVQPIGSLISIKRDSRLCAGLKVLSNVAGGVSSIDIYSAFIEHIVSSLCSRVRLASGRPIIVPSYCMML